MSTKIPLTVITLMVLLLVILYIGLSSPLCLSKNGHLVSIKVSRTLVERCPTVITPYP